MVSELELSWIVDGARVRNRSTHSPGVLRKIPDTSTHRGNWYVDRGQPEDERFYMDGRENVYHFLEPDPRPF